LIEFYGFALAIKDVSRFTLEGVSAAGAGFYFVFLHFSLNGAVGANLFAQK